MFFNIIVLLIGFLIFCTGIYYLLKSSNDKESKKIYSITSIIGAVIVIVFIFKIFFQ